MGLQEFKSADELMAHYRALEERKRARKPPPPKPIPIVDHTPEPEPVEVAPPPYPSMKEIMRLVAREHQVTILDIISERRTAKIVRPRQIVFYLAKLLTPLSIAFIGRTVGERDHSTVVHAIKKISGVMRQNEGLEREVRVMADKLMEGRRALD